MLLAGADGCNRIQAIKSANIFNLDFKFFYFSPIVWLTSGSVMMTGHFAK
jgi:hypothetical protein